MALLEQPSLSTNSYSALAASSQKVCVRAEHFALRTLLEQQLPPSRIVPITGTRNNAGATAAARKLMMNDTCHAMAMSAWFVDGMLGSEEANPSASCDLRALPHFIRHWDGGWTSSSAWARERSLREAGLAADSSRSREATCRAELVEQTLGLLMLRLESSLPVDPPRVPVPGRPLTSVGTLHEEEIDRSRSNTCAADGRPPGRDVHPSFGSLTARMYSGVLLCLVIGGLVSFSQVSDSTPALRVPAHALKNVARLSGRCVSVPLHCSRRHALCAK
jgi:hypothetical protein